MPAHPERGAQIIVAMARNVASAARNAASVTASGVRHAAWYLRYQVDGSSRAQKARPPRRR
jgi:hypothetical protein